VLSRTVEAEMDIEMGSLEENVMNPAMMVGGKL
jgi:hypothetical protein